MTQKTPDSSAHILDELLTLTHQLRSKKDHEPTENPVLTLAQNISQRLDSESLSMKTLKEIIQKLRDSAFLSHARHLQSYLEISTQDKIDQRMEALIQKLVQESGYTEEPDKNKSFERFRNLVETEKFAAIFTAHPTFSLANPVYTALANMASHPIDDETQVPFFMTHRRNTPPTLDEELQLANEAITRGRNALDMINYHIFKIAKQYWPEKWTELVPCPILLSSWVGYDIDGRRDIGWWDSLMIRLRMKKLQLERLYQQLDNIPKGVSTLKSVITTAINHVKEQIQNCPTEPDPDSFSRFSRILIENRHESILSGDQLIPLFDQALQQIDEDFITDLLVARAGFLTHGLSLSHSHVRLNSMQIHNMARQRLGITSNPDNPSHIRTLLNTVNAALDNLDNVEPIPVDFGSLLMEKASASILMMLLTQILKHIDSTTPIRFLIAETENGYTLLTALWLARLFGIESKIEISPLFETDYALNHGDKIIEQALRSPHWRNYLKKTGKLCLQFGYSDSGRFIGQIAATYQIEKLRRKIVQLLAEYELNDVTLILFDTHGESIGRGAHPFSMKERLQYLSPKITEAYFNKLGIKTRQETAFQGGDGYLLFGTQILANSTISIIAEHIFDFSPAEQDPIYKENDFNADFFSTIISSMRELINDKGYTTLLGTFGPSLIDQTGSRSAIRQSSTVVNRNYIKHPRELRAIPNNAILQQLGWCANTLQGLGTAISTNPETFQEMLHNSKRFRQSLDLARHALKHSDTSVLRAIIYMMDPGIWLDRAALTQDQNKQESYLTLANGLQRLNCWADTQAVFHHIQKDHILLLAGWKNTPCMDDKEILLHAIRLVLIEKIWMLSTKIPYFSPSHEYSRDNLDIKILCLEIPDVLHVLISHIFPQASEHVSDLYFYEPKGPRNEGAYAMDNKQIFKPMQHNFDLIREITIALIHRLHALG